MSHNKRFPGGQGGPQQSARTRRRKPQKTPRNPRNGSRVRGEAGAPGPCLSKELRLHCILIWNQDRPRPVTFGATQSTLGGDLP